ncbi:MAG: globin domain-containing protein [Bacteroidota bacterium]
MTNAQIELVQHSWKIVTTTNAQTAGWLLYNNLQEIVPEIKIKFRHSHGTEPARKIFSIISYLTRKLHKPNVLTEEVEKITRRHVKYHLRDELYIKAGKALIYAPETGLGDNWNQEIKNAWVMCYITIAEAIRDSLCCPKEEWVACC